MPKALTTFLLFSTLVLLNYMAWGQCAGISDVKIRVNNNQDISLLSTPGTIDICDVLDPLEVTLIFEGVTNVMATVDWGDGSIDNLSSGNTIPHIYDENLPSNPQFNIDIEITEVDGSSCSESILKPVSMNRRTFVIGIPQNFMGGLACLPASGDFNAELNLDAGSLSENSSITVDWGDGAIDNFTEQQIQDNGGTLPITHLYGGVVVTDVFNVAVTSQNSLNSGCVLQAPVIQLSFQNEIIPTFTLSGDICESGGVISISKTTTFPEPSDEGDFRWIIENATTATTLLETSFEGAFIVSNINFAGDLNTFDLELLDAEINDGDDVQVTLIERNSCGETSLTLDANILSLPNTSFSTFDSNAIIDPLAVINSCLKDIDIEFNNSAGFDHEWILVDGHGIVELPATGLTSFNPPLSLTASQITPGNKTLFVRSLNDVAGVACDNFIKLELSIRSNLDPAFTISGDLSDNCGSLIIDLDASSSTNLMDGDEIIFEYATNSAFTQNFNSTTPIIFPSTEVIGLVLNHLSAADEDTYFVRVRVTTPEGCDFVSPAQEQVIKDQPDGVNFNVQLVNGGAPSSDESNFIFCAGDRVSVQLSSTSSNNSVFNWTPPTDAVIDDPTPNNRALVFIVSANSDGSTIAVEEDLFGCTFTSTSAPVTVNQIPGEVAIDIVETNGDGNVDDGSFCEAVGSFVTLSADTENTGSWTYQWFKDGSAVSGATSQMLQLDQVSESGDYTVSVLGAGVCLTDQIDVTPITIEIQPALSASLSITAGVDAFCEGSGSVSLTAIEAGGLPFQTNAVQWYKFDGSTFVPEIITTSVRSFTLSSQSGEYRVEIFGAGNDNCPSILSNSVAITINEVPPTPSIAVVAGFSAITCSDPNPIDPDVKLELLNTATYAPLGDFNFTWKNSGVEVMDTDGDPTTLEVKGSANDGEYTVEVTTVAGNCTSIPSNIINIEITDPPSTIPNIITSNNSVCVNEGDITLSADNNPGGLGLEWFSSTTANFSDATPVATTTTIVVSDGAASSLYYFARFIADPSGAECEGASSTGTQVIVNPLPTSPSVSASATSICEGDMIILNATPRGAETEFRWYRLPDTNSPIEDVMGSVITSNTLNILEPGLGQNYVARSVSALGCLSANSSAVSVDITPLPEINTSIAFSDISICQGESLDVSIPGTSTNFLYELIDNSNNVLASSNGNNGLLVLNSGGLSANISLNVRATVDVVLCNQIITPTSVDITVFEPAPIAELITTDGNAVICSGQSIPLQLDVPTNARPPFQVNYRLNGGSDVNVVTSSTIPLIFNTNPITTNTTIELVSVTDDEGCSVTSITTSPNPLIITVDNPNSATLTGPASICSGDQLTVSLSISGGIGPFNYEIAYGGNTISGFTTSPHNTESIVLPVPLTTVTTVSLVSVSTANSCDVNNLSTDFDVAINNPQGVIAISDNEICANATPTLSIDVTDGSGPYTVQIEDSDGDLINLTSYSDNSPITIPPAIIPPSGTEIFTLNSVIDNSTGCSVNVQVGSDEVTLLVNPLPIMPTITVVGANIVCFGESVTLEGPVVGAGVGYEWYDATDLGTVIATTKDLIQSSVQNTDYRLRLIGDQGDSDCQGPLSSSVNVVISSLPEEPTINTIGSTTFCDDGVTNVTLVASASGADSFEWFEVSSPAVTVSTTSTLVLDNVSQTGSYSVRSASTATGCISATTPTAITINIVELPGQPEIEKESGLDDPFCDDGVNTITLRSSLVGDSYQWYKNGSAIATTTRTLELSDASESGAYTVSVVNANPISCEGPQSDPRIVAIVSLPTTPTVDISGTSVDSDGIFCDDGATSVSLISSVGGTSYNWYFDDGSGEVLLSSNTQEITLDEQVESGIYSVEVVGASSTNCISVRSAPRVVSINEIPVAPTISGIDRHCVGKEDEFFFVTPLTGATYNWSIPTGVISDLGGSSGDSFVRLSFPSAGSFDLQLSVTTNDCESPISSFRIEVLEPTTTSAITGETTVCENTSNLIYSVVETSNSDYSWSVPGGAFITDGQGTHQITVQYGTSAAAVGNSILQVVETNTAGCESVAVQQLITINPNPSAIIGGTFDICENESFAIEINWTGALPLTLDYSIDGVSQSTPLTIPVGAPNPFVLNVSPASTTIYTLDGVSDDNSCDGLVSGLTRINVSPAPQLEIGANQAIPQGSDITIIPDVLSGSFTSISWGANPVTSGSFDNVNAITPIFTPLAGFTGSITISAAITDASAICPDVVDDFILTVNAAGSIFAGNDLIICNGDIASFVDAAKDIMGDYDDYFWSSNRPGTFSNPAISGPLTDDDLDTDFTPSGGTGEYVITLEAVDTDGALPLTSGSFVLAVNQEPDALLINTGDKFICDGENAVLSVQLSGNSVSGPWTIIWEDNLGNTGSETGISTSPFDFQVPGVAGESRTYSIQSVSEDDNIVCLNTSPSSSRVTVTKRFLPTAEIISVDIEDCVGITPEVTVDLTRVGPWGIRWSDDGGTTSTQINNITSSPFTFPVSATTGTTTYTLVEVLENNDVSCNGTIISNPQVVTINPLPTATIAGSTTICEGQSTDLTFMLTGTSPWSVTYNDGSNDIIIPVANASHVVSVSPTSTTTYTLVSVLDNNGCVMTGLTQTAVVQVRELPTVDAGANRSVPVNTVVSLTPTLGGSFTDVSWSDGGAGGTFGNAATSNTSYVPPAGFAGSITLTLTTGDGTGPCADDIKDQLTVTYNAAGSVVAGSNEVICNGDGILLADAVLAADYERYSWSSDRPGAFSLITLDNPTSASDIATTFTPSNGIGDYIVTLTAVDLDAILPDASATLTVSVYALPMVAIAGSATICDGQNADLTFTLTGAAPWSVTYNDGNADITIPVASSPHTVNVSPVVNTTYTLVSVSDNNLCSTAGLTQSVLVQVRELPTVDAGSSQSVPLNTEVSLAPTVGGSFTSVLWDDGGTGGTFGNSATSNTSYTPAVGFVGDVTLTLTIGDGAGPCDDTISDFLTVTYNAAGSVVAGNNEVICNGDGILLADAVLAAGYERYSWSSDRPGAFSLITLDNPTSASDIATTFTPSNGIGDYIVTLTAVDLDAILPDASATLTVSVDALPTATITGSATICEGQSTDLTFMLTGTAPWSVTYNDGSNDITIPAASASHVVSVSPTSTMTYTLVSVLDNNGCVTAGLTQTAVIQVRELPTVDVGADLSVPINTVVSLTPTLGGSFTDILWNDGGAGGTFGNPNTSNTGYVPPSDFTGQITLTITIGDGSGPCADDIEDRLTVTYNEAGAINAGADQISCTGNTVSLVGTVDSQYEQVQWSSNRSGAFSSSMDLISDFTPSDGNGVYILRLTATDAEGFLPTIIDQVQIDYNILPTAQFINTEERIICTGDLTTLTVQLNGSSSSGPWELIYQDDLGNSFTQENITESNYQLDVNGTPGQSRTYTLISVSENDGAACTGGIVGDPVVVTERVEPTAEIISTDLDVCLGEDTEITVALTGDGPWNIRWSDNGGVTSLPENSITATPYTFSVNAPVGTTTYSLVSVTELNGILCSGTIVPRAVDIKVNEIPTASLSGNNSVCNGESADLTLILSGTAPWDVIYTDGTNTLALDDISASPFKFSVSPGTTTSYSLVNVSDGNNNSCFGSISGSALIQVQPLPQTNPTIDRTSFCSSDMVQVNGNPSSGSGVYVGHRWSGSGAAFLNNPAIPDPVFQNNVTATTDYELIYSVQDQNTCEVVSGILLFTVNPKPTVNPMASVSQVCSGEVVSITGNASGGVGFLDHVWTGDGAAFLNNDRIANPDFSAVVSEETTYTLFYSAVDNNGCGDEGSITITVFPEIRITSFVDEIICQGEDLVLNANVTGKAIELLWISEIPGVFEDDGSANTIFSPDPDFSGSGTIRLTASDSEEICNEVSTSFNLDIKEAITVSVGNNQTVCQGETVNLTAEVGGNFTDLQWTSSGRGELSDTNEPSSSYIPAIDEIGIVEFILTASDGSLLCSSATGRVSVNFNRAISIDINADDEFCQGDPILIQGTVTGTFSELNWISNNGGSFSNVNTAVTTYFPASDETGVVELTLIATDTEGICPNESESISVEINQRPVVEAGDNIAINEGETAVISGLVTGRFDRVEWSSNKEGSFSPVDQPVSVYTPELNEEGFTVLTLTAFDDSGICGSVSDQLVLEIVPRAPIAQFSTDLDEGCLPFEVAFTNESLEADEDGYFWDFGDGSNVVNASDVRHTFQTAGSFTVTLTATNSAGATSQATTEVRVFNLPTAVFSIDPTEYFIPDPLKITNTSIGGLEYFWDFGDGTTSSEFQPLKVYDTPGTYQVSLLVRSQQGCESEFILPDEIIINEGGSLEIPNAFTPNVTGPGDGRIVDINDNDVFLPVVKGVAEFNMKIFNRWGAEVFESNDPEIGWTGYINNELANSGTYSYVIKIRFSDGQVFDKAGTLNLIR